MLAGSLLGLARCSAMLLAAVLLAGAGSLRAQVVDAEAALVGMAPATSASTASPLAIRSVRTAGSGCPARSVGVLIQDNLASVLFSSYSVTSAAPETGSGRVPRSVAMRNCTVAITLGVPDGVTVAVSGLDWQGVLALEPGAQARFARMFSVGGRRVVGKTEVYAQPGPTAIVLHDDVTGVVVSGCRTREASLMASTSLTLFGVGAGSIDSVDVGAGMKIGLRLGSCRSLAAGLPRPAR